MRNIQIKNNDVWVGNRKVISNGKPMPRFEKNPKLHERLRQFWLKLQPALTELDESVTAASYVRF